MSTERRTHSRSTVDTQVYLRVPERGMVRCRATNLSARGVFVATHEPTGLRVGAVTELLFVIDQAGVSKTHRLAAVVMRRSTDGLGLTFRRSTRLPKRGQPAVTVELDYRRNDLP